ncbi:beta-ketoacyl synthase N-terminal-like domain-containing protein, partial [Paenibacillus forsythiae]
KWGGFLEGVNEFDPLFFNLSPLEAEIMDPQERLFLETVWNLFESVGQTRQSLADKHKGQVGVYVGAMYQHYKLWNAEPSMESLMALSSYSSIANRVSHFFDFMGPSIAIDTMCSSSAIAVHMACESLKKGECEVAVAGGVNLSIHPKKYVGLSLSQLIGSNPDSRSFSNGDGYLPAEGVGAVLLKPLNNAIADGDTILAVIKSTATNHGGHTHGFGVPNPQAQAQLMEDNFRKSGIDPRTVSYIESAANGSSLGDPIEIAALKKVFHSSASEGRPYTIGSVKSNIGHAEAASGISQLTKVILQLQHRQLVESIKAEPMNPNIQLNGQLHIQRELETWNRPVLRMEGQDKEIPLRAAINSFGAGGSNAHIIVEEYIPAQPERTALLGSPTPQAVILSAKNKGQLKVAVRQLLEFAEEQADVCMNDLAYTLQVGREAMDIRLALVVGSREEMIQGLRHYLAADEISREADPTLYIGDAQQQPEEFESLFSGRVGERFLEELIKERELEKLALYWAKGGSVAWERLPKGDIVRRIMLPTYPFEKRSCWIHPVSIIPEAAQLVERIEICSTKMQGSEVSAEERIIEFVSGLVGLEPEAMNAEMRFRQLGMGSLQLMQLLQKLQAQFDPSISIKQLQECVSIRDLAAVLTVRQEEAGLSSAANSAVSVSSWPEYPELIRLNQLSTARPVFWFHGANGGVEVYQDIAQKCGRPFYGIQASGRATDNSSLHGIPEMAAYYAQIVRTVQPEGPYDLGGYSLGGLFAYEVTRILQKEGQTVQSIVMVDSMYNQEIANAPVSVKSVYLQTMNTALLASDPFNLERAKKSLIHWQELDPDDTDEAFLQKLICLAGSRGLTQTAVQLLTQVERNLKVQLSYELKNYTPLPLPDPQGTTCYYFRNKNGKFFGDMEPYFTFGLQSLSFDEMVYWEEWTRLIPNLNLIDVDSPNHMLILHSPSSAELITALCEKLYSVEGMSDRFFKSFIKKYVTPKIL